MAQLGEGHLPGASWLHYRSTVGGGGGHGRHWQVLIKYLNGSVNLENIMAPLNANLCKSKTTKTCQLSQFKESFKEFQN